MTIRNVAILVLAFFGAFAEGQSIGRSARKAPGIAKAVCSPGAICFSGKVSNGEEFRNTLNADLEFVLKPGWIITVVPKRPEGECREFAFVANPPYMAHNDLDINATYGWTADEEVTSSPREFRFVIAPTTKPSMHGSSS